MRISVCTAPKARLSVAVVLGLLLSASSARAAVSVSVGSVTGVPGSTVMFFVTLSATAGEQVAGTQTTITFQPETPVVQCATNPAFVISLCDLFPAGCTAGVSCQTVGCFIAPFGGTIPTGSELYVCNVNIAGNAAGGNYPLHCAAVDVRDSAGNSLNPQCTDGEVRVAVPTPTPSATATPTATATPAPITAAVGAAAKNSTTLALKSPASAGFPRTGTIIQIGSTTSLSIGYTLGSDNTTMNLSSPLPVDVVDNTQIIVVQSGPAPGGGGGGGCQLASTRQSNPGWLLLVPAAVWLWQRRRRHR